MQAENVPVASPTLEVETLDSGSQIESPTTKASTPSADSTTRPESVGAGGKENAPLSPSKPAKESSSAPAKAMSPAPMSPSKPTIPETIKSPAKAEVPPPAQTEQAAQGDSQAEPKLFVVEAHHETEEVIERLLDVKGLEQSVTGLWGWMSGSVSKVAEQASKVKEQAAKVAEQASQQASVVAKEASQTVTQVAGKASQQAAKAKAMAEQQAKELAATVSKTMEDKAPTDAKPAASFPSASLPWETAHPERRAEARDRVLKLSMDDHTFTVPPPKEAQYSYDVAEREPYAARMLDTDALLAAKRFKLVPKTVDEHEFWRNYFYRVDMILSALGVPATGDSPAKKSEDAASSKQSMKQVAASEATHLKELEDEMRKEIARAEASHLEDSVKEDENFDMLEDDLEFEDDPELEKSINDLKL